MFSPPPEDVDPGLKERFPWLEDHLEEKSAQRQRRWTETHAGPAAVLVGDALHAFPPDLGQGVNSALEDVMTLRDSLGRRGDGRTAEAAVHYEDVRAPEARALVETVRVAAPFQYSQAPLRSQIWTMSFLARFLLHKALPGVFDLPLFLLVQQSELSYSEVLRRGRRGARRSTALLCLVAAGALRLLVR